MTSSKVNAPNTEYNKDKTFHKINSGTTGKFGASEAIAIDGEKDFVIYCYLDTATGVESFGDKNYKFEPCPARITFSKTSYTRSYNGKDTKVESTASIQALHKLISEKIGFDKPFSFFIDLDAPPAICDSIVSGKEADGTEVSAAGMASMVKYFLGIASIEALDKLKDVEIDKSAGGGKGGYAKGQTEHDKLCDRLKFTLTTAPELLKAAGFSDEEIKTYKYMWIERIV